MLMEKSILVEKNPWWKGREHLAEDRDYEMWLKNPIRWLPSIVEEMELKPYSLHILLGPRQTGKTTAVKLIIQNLLEKAKDTRAVFYFRCDLLKDYKELLEVLNAYLDYREEAGIKTSYIFLDEVTAPEEWFRAIKELIDSNRLKNDVVVLTGSTSMKIKKTTELFPGRRGYGRDFILLPLSFREFVNVLNPELHKKLPLAKSLYDVRKACMNALPHINELSKLFEIYLKTGGFPLAVISWKKSGLVDEATKEAYLSWIKNDLYKAGKDESIAREITKAVLTKIPSRLSWEGISKEISVKSPKTVNSYLNVFTEMFLTHIAYYLDPNTGFVKFAKNKKIAFIDPLVYRILEDWCLIKMKDPEPVIVEGIVAAHISRVVGGSTKVGEVYYWANSTEVDIVARTKEKIIGFEVKWEGKAEEKRLIVGRMKDVFVLSKSTFDPKRNILPIPLFLAVLHHL